jgi:hypothetical protein
MEIGVFANLIWPHFGGGDIRIWPHPSRSVVTLNVPPLLGERSVEGARTWVFGVGPVRVIKHTWLSKRLGTQIRALQLSALAMNCWEDGCCPLIRDPLPS